MPEQTVLFRHPKIAPYLSRWLAKHTETIISRKNGEPVPVSWYRNTAFAPIMKELEIPEATPHWCRHTFATRLFHAGADPLTTRWLMDSTDNDITEHYTHETIDTLVKNIRLLA